MRETDPTIPTEDLSAPCGAGEPAVPGPEPKDPLNAPDETPSPPEESSAPEAPPEEPDPFALPPLPQIPENVRRRRRTLTVILVVTLYALLCGAGFFFSSRLDIDIGISDPDNTLPPEQAGETGQTQEETSRIPQYDGSLDFSLPLSSSEGLEPLTYQEIYRKVNPSVVTITVFSKTAGSFATGIILSEDGLILTNQHVVAEMSTAYVTTVDEVTYDAWLVGEDPNSDLAVLKIDAQGLTPAEFSDSSAVLVGDECFAIGNPLGVTYRGTFSNGIISAINRDVVLNGYSMTLMQTTAALNSGNSGGPLINIYGQVIGVNNMKLISSTTTVEGLGFAIPSQTTKTVVDSLIAHGDVDHPALGITGYALTSQSAMEMEVPQGIYVSSVDPGSDARKKGLLAGDVITEIDGRRVTSMGTVREILADHQVGDTIHLRVYRTNNKSTGSGYFEFHITLMELNDIN